VLGAATGISWGFVAAIIKELSSRLGGGLGAIVASWSLYALIAIGAATLLLASHPWPPGRGILGRWRITEMDNWDQEAVDLVKPVLIEFDEDGLGELAACHPSPTCPAL
jgi:hypothetical protein